MSIPHKYGKYDDASNIEKQESVCPADGVTKRYSIWLNPIKKCTSNGMWRIIADSAYGCIRRGYCFVAQFSAAKFSYGYFRNYFRGRIFTPSKRESSRTTPLMQLASNWYGFKGSVDKTTNENYILSMIRSMNIIQTGKGSTVVKMGTLQYCSSWPSICRGAKNSS